MRGQAGPGRVALELPARAFWDGRAGERGRGRTLRAGGAVCTVEWGAGADNLGLGESSRRAGRVRLEPLTPRAGGSDHPRNLGNFGLLARNTINAPQHCRFWAFPLFWPRPCPCRRGMRGGWVDGVEVGGRQTPPDSPRRLHSASKRRLQWTKTTPPPSPCPSKSVRQLRAVLSSRPGPGPKASPCHVSTRRHSGHAQLINNRPARDPGSVPAHHCSSINIKTAAR